jgi:cytidylate kinase
MMAIITISRELAALGDETAHELVGALQYRFIDKKSLEERMKDLGALERQMIKYDERKPSFLASFSQDRDDYLHYLKTAIYAEAGKGNCIFMGRGTNVLLRGIPGVLSVFLSSPAEIRQERVKSYFYCDERRSRQIIQQSDRDREGFYQYFFEQKWRNPENYHLALNTGHIHPKLCAALIKTILEQTNTEEQEAEHSRRIKDLILGQQVVHHIRYDKTIPIHFLEAAAESGSVTLYGVVNSPALIEAAVTSAKEVPEVNSVASEIQVVQEYSVIP